MLLLDPESQTEKTWTDPVAWNGVQPISGKLQLIYIPMIMKKKMLTVKATELKGGLLMKYYW